ncbi:MAG: hypothetical protein UH080_03790 [Ruminococcus sp.]|nr:hypothetical protein [Ruminococcus sp.]
MKSINLKQYIEKVYLLEKLLYEQQTVEVGLQYEINRMNNDEAILEAVNTNGRYIEGNNSPYQRIRSKNFKYDFSDGFEKEFFLGFIVFSFFLFVVLSVIFLALSDDIELYLILSDRFWEDVFSSLGKAFGIAVSAFIGLSILYFVYNVIKYFIENGKIRKENLQIDIDNKVIIQNNNNTFEKRFLLRENMQKEHSFIYGKISETTEVLQKLYSLDIIYPKYRNLCALSSFYEYFESGRCDTLVGHEGAYNIFENEVRLDRIVVQLDKVIEKLDQIKRNQFMLYEAISESQKISNDILNEIKATNRELKNVQSQNENIIDNSRVTAYNSKIIAQNSEFLKWYAAYK